MDRGVVYRINERKNGIRKGGSVWELQVSIDGHQFWTIWVWNKKPTEKQENEAVKLMLRSFEIWDRHIPPKPPFKIKVDKL